MYAVSFRTPVINPFSGHPARLFLNGSVASPVAFKKGTKIDVEGYGSILTVEVMESRETRKGFNDFFYSLVNLGG